MLSRDVVDHTTHTLAGSVGVVVNRDDVADRDHVAMSVDHPVLDRESLLAVLYSSPTQRQLAFPIVGMDQLGVTLGEVLRVDAEHEPDLRADETDVERLRIGLPYDRVESSHEV